MKEGFGIFLEDLFIKNYEKLWHYACIAIGNDTAAEDVVQESFCVALRRGEKLSIHRNPSAWLMVTLKFKIMEHKRHETREGGDALSLPCDVPWNLKLDEELSYGDVADMLGISLGELAGSLSYEEFCFMKRLLVEEATHRQVAEEFGISVSASQKRLQRVRHKLKEKYIPTIDK